MKPLDCIIIGAGQSGLYTAHCLDNMNLNYLVIERNQVGDVWRNRLKGMKLFTSRQFCSLPGLTFPGDANTFPNVTEVADYLQNYADHFNLIISEKTNVQSVSKKDNLFVVKTSDGDTYQSKTIINATGSNQVCIVPDMSRGLSKSVTQYTADTNSFDSIPNDSRVVVVGAGASGRQIAGKLAEQCQKVILATGRERGLPPNTVAGKDIFWWLRKIGVLFADTNSLVAKVLKKRNPVPCGNVNNKNLKNKGVDIYGRVVSCNDKNIGFSCGAESTVDAVIWAIGYRDDTSWLQIDKCVDNNEFKHHYGVSPEPGLFIVGRKWLSCRASELIMGVERDVNRVMKGLTSYLGETN